MAPIRSLSAAVIAFTLAATSFSLAQQPAAKTTASAPRPVVGRALRMAVTPPLRELPESPAPRVLQREQLREVPMGELPRAGKELAGVPAPVSPDAAVQAAMPPAAMPATSTHFEGIGNAQNASLYGFQLLPPDTVGDVGPNHYVQMVNLAFQVFDKSGVALTPARKVSDLFAALETPCSIIDDGDPIVLYDELADRWILTQFCLIFDPFAHQMIAVSQTGDPTGAYFVYDFPMPNEKFNDYPKFGVWPDAYYMMDHQFIDTFAGTGVFAFERAKMLVGDPTASYIYFDLELMDPTIGGSLPADLDGPPPPPGTPGYFAYFLATEFGDAMDGIRIFEFRADFANPGNSSFTERAESPIPVAAFDPSSPFGRDDIEQPGTLEALDSISDRFMHRLAYRNFGGSESLVVSHTVNVGTETTLGTHQAGVRYYQLSRSLPGGSFTVAEQATFAPDTDNRWMPSAAMDHQGNIAVGYSVSSGTTFPAIRYAGRLAGDPPNGLAQGEATLIAGAGSQTHSASRWGDYSAMSVDPSDGCTFWFTSEYYSATSSLGWQTRIGRFAFPSCTPPAVGGIGGQVTDAFTGLPIAGATVTTTAGYMRLTQGGFYDLTLPAGTYDLTYSAPDYIPVNFSDVVAPSGSVNLLNVQLQPVKYVFRSPIRLPASGSSGAAEPYPSTITVSGISGTVRKVAVRLVGLQHSAPGDLDFLLVAPNGAQVMLMSDAGAGWSLDSPVTIALDHVVSKFLPDDERLTSGRFQTTDYEPGDSFASPAPAPNGNTALNVVSDANGVWQLFAMDDSEGNIGTLEAWELELSVEAGGGGSITIVDDAAASPYPSNIAVASAAIGLDHVRVAFNSFTHTFPADVQALLVGPDGTNTILMAGAGGGQSVVANLDFDDFADQQLPTPLTNGVFRPTSFGIYPFPSPAPTADGRIALASFRDTDPNGTWSLYVTDVEPDDSGSLTNWFLQLGYRFSNRGTMLADGSASSYPSVIRISGVTAAVQWVVVKLEGLHHASPDDLDLLLVGPTGANAIIMSDAGGSNSVLSADLTLDDRAAGALPDSGPLSSGAFQPANYAPADSFPSPAPTPSGQSALSTFSGLDPNGEWKLFIVDDNTGSTGRLAGGWTLELHFNDGTVLKKRGGQLVSE